MDIETVRQATAKLREAMNLFASGPLDYYISELVASHDLLMTRFAPFKPLDRVVLLKTPDFDDAPGWKHCRHFLKAGATGTVVAASCGSMGFRFDVVFDDESWIDECGYGRKKGTIVPMEEGRKHRYCFGENWLAHETPNVEAQAQPRQRLSPGATS